MRHHRQPAVENSAWTIFPFIHPKNGGLLKPLHGVDGWRPSCLSQSHRVTEVTPYAARESPTDSASLCFCEKKGAAAQGKLSSSGEKYVICYLSYFSCHFGEVQLGAAEVTESLPDNVLAGDSEKASTNLMMRTAKSINLLQWLIESLDE